MLALLKNRNVMIALGLLLLAIVIWFAGPYFAFADYRPLQGAVGRLVSILVLVSGYAGYIQFRQVRSARSDRQLADEVTKQDIAGDKAASADASQLRKRFEEAMETLKRSRRRGGAGLYELPWYIIIGPPGSGKTTVLVNSGLNFPLAQKFGKEALRGVGGTRNCDWWFTDEAILLDTAGRYTTQDSNTRADAAGWAAFLQLLKKYRRRQPINGVIVAMSASDLLTLGDQEREQHAVAIRERLDELSRNLRIDVPVYFLVTKTDLVAGFTEFFDELGQDARAQVWGTTFPIDVTEAGRAAEAFGKEFDSLIERLNQRVLFRIEGERDPRRRIGILAFPQQMALLKPLLNGLLKRVFTASDFDNRVLLRGVYFTSGTQEGTPVDRMLGAVARTFGFSAAVAPPAVGQGKAYFIERLLKSVIFHESGLAGVNRRLQVQKVALQSAAYVACGVVLIIGLVGLMISYNANADYIDDVIESAKDVKTLQPGLAARGLPYEAYLPWLDTLRSIAQTAERYKDEVPWRMRMGLYRGNSLGEAARDAYSRELSGLLPGILSGRFEQELRANAAEPDRLYEYLKGYLMLGQPEHRDVEHLRVLGRLEWQRAFPDDESTSQRFSEHFDQLLGAGDRLRSIPVDAELVEQARGALRNASLPVLMYSRLKLSYLDDPKRAVRLDLVSGPSAQLVLVRRSGKSLSEPVPALYTRSVFKEIDTTGKFELIQQFADDSWVFGDNLFDVARSGPLIIEALQVYERDYIRVWDEVLKDVTLKPTSNAQELSDVLSVAASSTSPLKGLLKVVADNTDLLRVDPAAAGAKSLAERAIDSRAAQLARTLGAQSATAAKPGALVAAHFQPIRQLVAGPPGQTQLDMVLTSLGETQRQLAAIGTGLGDTSALDTLTRSGQADALRSLQLIAKQLPVPVGDMIAQIGQRTETVAVTEARVDLSRRYSERVLRDCRDLVEGRYPVNRFSTNDVPLADFARVFGPNGVFDAFFRENLAALIDTSRTPWQWRPGAAPIGGSASILRQFQNVQRIREAYFAGSGQTPEARFNLTADTLDASATRFSLEMDGQNFEYRHGPQQSRPLAWPGQSGQASFAFEDRGSTIPGGSAEGPWAWFRLLEKARVEKESATRYRVTFTAGGRSMRVILDAASSRNPFGPSPLSGFRCTM
jgi:type VI secretion system protein ImpL